MKYKGCTSYLAEERNEELLRAYNKILRRCGYRYFKDVYQLLRQVPSRRFWVTGQRAYEYIVRHKNGKKGYFDKEEMYAEIERRVGIYMSEHTVTLRQACMSVVQQPAPSFYLGEGTMRNIIQGMQRTRRKR